MKNIHIRKKDSLLHTRLFRIAYVEKSKQAVLNIKADFFKPAAFYEELFQIFTANIINNSIALTQ